jgi:hypothetical protein
MTSPGTASGAAFDASVRTGSPVTTDPTTEQMRQETGHDCPACPTDVRNLAATAHNALGALTAARDGVGDWSRAWRKVEELRTALAILQLTSDAHFAALNAWRRP